MSVRARLDRWLSLANEPCDASSLRAFRVALGLLSALAALRFFSHDWIRKYYQEPQLFFSYWGFSWIRPLPAPWMHVLYACIGGCGLLLAWGARPRWIAPPFALLFGYAHFCDQSNYLNHYYLLTLLAALACLLPARGTPQVRRWVLWLFRFQIGVVYFFGGVGKLGADWLWLAQPIRLWLPANQEMPLLGPLFRQLWAAYAVSWIGLVFDLSAPFLLSWRKSRPLLYVAVVVFHVLTALLFRIGLFPWFMIAFATVFFEPDWPRRLWAKRPWHRAGAREAGAAPHLTPPPTQPPLPAPSLPCRGALTRAGGAAICLYIAWQTVMPLRAALYPGNTLWSEEGFRFAWRVMLIDKSAELEYELELRDGTRRFVDARSVLTPVQLRQVTTQPDMILQLAHWLGARDPQLVAVYAHSHVSFNGRRPAPMIDPTVNLLAERDTLAPKRWILPAPR